VPHDYAPAADLATAEAQDAYLKAAFSSGHPVLIADAVNIVAQARKAAGRPDDDSWNTTFELFHAAANTQHLLVATAEAGEYLKATGQTLIEGPAIAWFRQPAQAVIRRGNDNIVTYR
jgi:hypothetical protein